MMSIETDYRALKGLHDSQNEAVIKLQEENGKLKDSIILLRAELSSSDKKLEINKDIMREALTLNNKMKEAYAEEIVDLRRRLKA